MKASFQITKKNHCDGDIFEHNFKLKANISPSQWFFIAISNPGMVLVVQVCVKFHLPQILNRTFYINICSNLPCFVFSVF